tara:strand:+ start:34 stop:141 length:108 start_codon:yes stop_codon:yes gene_type:complete
MTEAVERALRASRRAVTENCILAYWKKVDYFKGAK